MPMPGFTLVTDSTKADGFSELFSESEGIPDGGNETLSIPYVDNGFPPAELQENFLKIFLEPGRGVAAGVTDLAFVSLSADRRFITLDFTQTAPGVGTARVVIQIQHTIDR